MGIFGCYHEWEEDKIIEVNDCVKKHTQRCKKCGKTRIISTIQNHDFKNAEIKEVEYESSSYANGCMCVLKQKSILAKCNKCGEVSVLYKSE